MAPSVIQSEPLMASQVIKIIFGRLLGKENLKIKLLMTPISLGKKKYILFLFKYIWAVLSIE